MRAGIPVVNLAGSSTPRRPTAAGSAAQLRHGPQRRALHPREAQGEVGRPVIELAGLDNLGIPSSGTKGFNDALKNYPNIKKVARQAADFTVESGQAKMAQLLQAQSKFDALWNHDDDQGVGALRAIEQAGRDGFLMVGGAGALSAFQAIKQDDGVLKATVLYPPTMAASAIDLARALGQGKGIGGMAEFEIPASITLYSAVVDKTNVDQYMPTGFQ
ncbi:sugar ABC transporter substrate-binding protein [Streptomyces purpurascens]